jgi:hypothetical protein
MPSLYPSQIVALPSCRALIVPFKRRLYIELLEEFCDLFTGPGPLR